MYRYCCVRICNFMSLDEHALNHKVTILNWKMASMLIHILSTSCRPFLSHIDPHKTYYTPCWWRNKAEIYVLSVADYFLQAEIHNWASTICTTKLESSFLRVEYLRSNLKVFLIGYELRVQRQLSHSVNWRYCCVLLVLHHWRFGADSNNCCELEFRKSVWYICYTWKTHHGLQYKVTHCMTALVL